MCGIGVCILKKNIHKNKIHEILPIINKVQNHRGPDYSGTYFENNIGLCHTRLSIIDLSEKANQPFQAEKGNFLIVYNGEVYNYRELRDDLRGLGHCFESNSDTEVILKAYIEWGTNSFVMFDGMFAFAIYDKISNRLIVARDRLGIKPVHYYMNNEIIVFASEIKAIISIDNAIKYDDSAIRDILMRGHIEGEDTIFKNIYTLAPGQYCDINLYDFTSKIYKYIDILDEIDPAMYMSRRNIPMSDVVNELDGLLQKSVESHLISDAPLGSLCSGGLDSSLITAIAIKSNPNVKIYHAGVEGFGGEEIYAKKVANHLNVDINYIFMTREKFLESFVDVVYHSDSPIYHPNDIPLYHICRLANTQGVKVLLCGEGADELFGGYEWQKNFIKNISFKLCLNNKKFATKTINFLKDIIFKYFDYSDEEISDFICSAGLYQPYGHKNQFSLIKNYQVIYNRGYNLKRWNDILDSYKFLSSVKELCGNSIMLDNLFGHLSTILYRTDRMGMMASIENRVPFLENEMIKFAINLPLEYKIKKNVGKKVLKLVAERYLPKEIIYRRKQGFPVPFESYITYSEALFRNGFVSNYFSISSELLRKLTNGDVWLLFRILSLEIWGRLFVYNEDRSNIQDLLLNKL